MEIVPEAGHLIEIVVLDRDAPHCAGRNDPATLGCQQYRWWASGQPGASHLEIIVR